VLAGVSINTNSLPMQSLPRPMSLLCSTDKSPGVFTWWLSSLDIYDQVAEITQTNKWTCSVLASTNFQKCPHGDKYCTSTSTYTSSTSTSTSTSKLYLSIIWVELQVPITLKTRDSLNNWTCGKLSHIFSSATFNSETVLGFGWRFHYSFVSLSRLDISIPFR